MDKYQIVKKIGKGSYGNVYMVTSVTCGVVCVLKKIPLLEMDKKLRAQAKQEVQLMQLLVHPYLCKYMDSFLHNNEKLCIVMEHYTGGDLSNFITSRRKKPLQEPELMLVIAQILLGLQFMHARRVLHRDIKSQNIFIKPCPSAQGTGISVVIGDLGIARVLSSSQDLAHTAVGTPLYMSPEVCNGDLYNYPADIWSVGCVAYELAFFKHPFQSNDLSGLIMKIINANYTPPPVGKYSRAFTDLLARIFNKAPGKRPLTDSLLQMPLLRKHALKCHEAHLGSEAAELSDTLLEQLGSLGLVATPAEPVPETPATGGVLSMELDTLKAKAGQKRKTEKILRVLKDEAEHERLLIDDRINDLVKQQQQQQQHDATQKRVSSSSSSDHPPRLTAKERVLLQKQQKAEEHEREKLLALEAARKEGFHMRQGAKQAEFDQYHPNHGKEDKPGDKLTNMDSQIAELENEVASYRKQIGQIVGRIHQHIIEEGNTEPELLSPSAVFTSEGTWDYLGSDVEDEEPQSQPNRVDKLRASLVDSLTEPVFEEAYTLLRERDVTQDSSSSFQDKLREALPEEHLHLWQDIDQLIFMDTSLGH